MRAVLLGCLFALSADAWAAPAVLEVDCADSHVQVGISVLEQRGHGRMQGSALARTWCSDTLEPSQATLVDLVLADLCQIAELDGPRCHTMERLGRRQLDRALSEPRLVGLALDTTGEGDGKLGDLTLTFADDSSRRLSGSVHEDGRFETRSVVWPPAEGPEGGDFDCTVSLRMSAEGRVDGASPASVELTRSRTLLCRSPVGDRFLKLEVEHGEQASAADGIVGAGHGADLP